MYKIVNLNKSFKNQKVIENFNYKFNDKGLYSIIGKSGSGKSTLLNILASFETLDSGKIYFNNKDISLLTNRQKKELIKQEIGMVFQDFFLFNNYTVLQNIKIMCNISNIKYDEVDILKLLEKLNILEIKTKKVNELSGGEKQRVAILRCILKKSSVILCDEPTGNLDSENSQIVYNILKELSKSRLIILVTHDTLAAYEFSDYVLDLSNKKQFNKDIIDNIDTDNEIIIKESKMSFNSIFTISYDIFKSSLKSFKFSFLIIIILNAFLLMLLLISFSNPHGFEYEMYKHNDINLMFLEENISSNKLGNKTKNDSYYDTLEEYKKISKDIKPMIYEDNLFLFSKITNKILMYDNYDITGINALIIDDNLSDNQISISNYAVNKMVEQGYIDSIDDIINTNFNYFDINLEITDICEVKTNTKMYDNTGYLLSFFKVNSNTLNKINNSFIYEIDNINYFVDTGVDFSVDRSITSVNNEKIELLEGRLPVNNNEVTVQKSNASLLGDTITLNNKEYLVTGVHKVGFLNCEFVFTKNEVLDIIKNYGVNFITNNKLGYVYELSDKLTSIEVLQYAYLKGNNIDTSIEVNIDAIISTLYNIQRFCVLTTVIFLLLIIVLFNYIFKSLLKNNKSDFSILISLGISKKELCKLFGVKTSLILLPAYVISITLSLILLPLINYWYKLAFEISISPLYFSLFPYLISLMVILIVCIITIILENKRISKMKIIDLLYDRLY